MNESLPSWLPPKLVLPEGYLEREDLLHKVFQQTVVGRPLLFRNQPVHLNMTAFAGGKPEAFWHLVGCGDNRQIDHERAVRMPWFRALLEHPDDPAVRAWQGEGSVKGQLCWYLWLHEFDYFVVLAPGRRGGWFLVTAHHVEGARRRRDLLGRYRRAGGTA